MFELKRTGSNRLDMVLDGSIDSDAMRAALDAMERESAGIEHGCVLYDVVDFQMPSLSAILIELSRLPSMLKLIGRFDRVAVLTDKKWIGKAGELEGKLIPHLEIKAFTRDQRDQAEDWLKQP